MNILYENVCIVYLVFSAHIDSAVEQFVADADERVYCVIHLFPFVHQNNAINFFLSSCSLCGGDDKCVASVFALHPAHDGHNHT